MELVGRLLFVAAFVVPGIIYLLGFRGWLWIVGVSLVALSFVLEMSHYFALYYIVRCPRCGHNPTRCKNGKHVGTNTVWKRLRTMAACPQCSAPAKETHAA